MVRSAHILIAAAAALLGLGVIMVHSAGTSVAGPEGSMGDISMGPAGPWSMFLSKHTLYAGIAVLVMILASRINVRAMFTSRGWANPLFILILAALGFQILTLIPGMGHEVNGAARWLKVGPANANITFQPSELVKWVIVLAVAWWCARRRGVMHRFWVGVGPPALLIVLACALIVKEDLGTAVLIGAVALILLLAGGMRAWLLIPMGLASLGGIVYAIYAEEYRVQRIMIYLNPWDDPGGAGYHPIQSQLAFAQGGTLGSGLGNSIQKYYIPEDTTDFIFPVLAEELGLAGAALVIGLFLVILWTGFSVVRESKDTFARLVGLGILTTLGIQAAINLAVVTVVVPTKGIALPLISAGGTGWIMTAFALGLIAALDNANAIEEQSLTADDADDADDADQGNEAEPRLRLTG